MRSKHSEDVSYMYSPALRAWRTHLVFGLGLAETPELTPAGFCASGPSYVLGAKSLVSPEDLDCSRQSWRWQGFADSRGIESHEQWALARSPGEGYSSDPASSSASSAEAEQSRLTESEPHRQ